MAGVKMKYLLVILMMSLSVQASDYKYSIGGSQANIDYCWYGASEACFEYKLNVARFEVEHKSGFAFRFGKAINKTSDTQTTITNQTFNIKFSKYEEFELIYKYELADQITFYGGIGYYRQSLPIYSVGNELIKYDKDNDNGYILGVLYNFNSSISVDLMVKQTSAIGDAGGSCDEECLSNWQAKGSTIRQVSLGLMYKF